MFPHSKSTILHCTETQMPKVITRQQESILKAQCYANQQLSIISTHMHGEAQTQLGRFVVNILYKQVCNKSSSNQTDQA